MANIVDYSIPYNHEKPIFLTPVNDEMNSNYFSYFNVFEANVWSVIMISLLTIVLMLSLFWKMVLIEQHLSFQLISEISLRLYASYLNKGIQ